ncbi:MAG: hypothetical protein ACPLRW_02510 [Moorellales bacterium]
METLVPQERPAMPTIIDILPLDIDREIEKAKLGRDALDKLFDRLLVPGVDYDRIPGTDKPTLLKAGAELLCQVFHLAPGRVEIISKEEDFVTGVFSYTVGVPILHRETGILVAYGVGSANSKEPKYRYRKSKDDPEIKIENPDPAGDQNTLVKMAAKRALIDGVLKATGASRKFTQDAEDLMPPEKASTKQINFIKSLFKGKEEMQIFAEMSDILDRPVLDWDLTREEASKVIEAKKGQTGQTMDRKQTIPDAPKPTKTKEDYTANGVNWQSFWEAARNLGYDESQVHTIASEIFGSQVSSLKEVIRDQKAANLFLQELAKRKNAKQTA